MDFAPVSVIAVATVCCVGVAVCLAIVCIGVVCLRRSVDFVKPVSLLRFATITIFMRLDG